jgi:hypothetical protein
MLCDVTAYNKPPYSLLLTLANRSAADPLTSPLMHLAVWARAAVRPACAPLTALSAYPTIYITVTFALYSCLAVREVRAATAANLACLEPLLHSHCQLHVGHPQVVLIA